MDLKKIINPWCDCPEYNCFGCSPKNPIGLHLQFFEDGDYIVSKWQPGNNYQGWVNTMHGGIPTTELELTIRAKVTRQVRNLAYISAEIINSQGEVCNEGEAIYFLMNQEKALEMGFRECKVEE